jgi:hypothetical protein
MRFDRIAREALKAFYDKHRQEAFAEKRDAINAELDAELGARGGREKDAAIIPPRPLEPEPKPADIKPLAAIVAINRAATTPKDPAADPEKEETATWSPETEEWHATLKAEPRPDAGPVVEEPIADAQVDASSSAEFVGSASAASQLEPGATPENPPADPETTKQPTSASEIAKTAAAPAPPAPDIPEQSQQGSKVVPNETETLAADLKQLSKAERIEVASDDKEKKRLDAMEKVHDPKHHPFLSLDEAAAVLGLGSTRAVQKRIGAKKDRLERGPRDGTVTTDSVRKNLKIQS